MSVVSRLRMSTAITGGVVAWACVVGAVVGNKGAEFFNAYLYAYLFWLGISLGSLAIVLLHNLTGGEWGRVVRRIADAAARLLPLMAVLFIPIVLGMHELFPWATG